MRMEMENIKNLQLEPMKADHISLEHLGANSAIHALNALSLRKHQPKANICLAAISQESRWPLAETGAIYFFAGVYLLPVLLKPRQQDETVGVVSDNNNRENIQRCDVFSGVHGTLNKQTQIPLFLVATG